MLNFNFFFNVGYEISLVENVFTKFETSDLKNNPLLGA